MSPEQRASFYTGGKKVSKLSTHIIVLANQLLINPHPARMYWFNLFILCFSQYLRTTASQQEWKIYLLQKLWVMWALRCVLQEGTRWGLALPFLRLGEGGMSGSAESGCPIRNYSPIVWGSCYIFYSRITRAWKRGLFGLVWFWNNRNIIEPFCKSRTDLNLKKKKN